jgi:hypothetical protein
MIVGIISTLQIGLQGRKHFINSFLEKDAIEASAASIVVNLWLRITTQVLSEESGLTAGITCGLIQDK